MTVVSYIILIDIIYYFYDSVTLFLWNKCISSKFYTIKDN